MATTTMRNKAELRQSALKARREVPRERLVQLSEAVMNNVVSSIEFGKSEILATYVAKDDEVMTDGIIGYALKEGKRVLVPVSRPSNTTLVFSELHDYREELAPGNFGVLEPKKEFLRLVPLEEANLVMVPVVAWDDFGHRLGYGKGYFDSALARVGMSTFTMGLALECQHVPRIPVEMHDVKLMAVATEKRIVRQARGRSGSE